jgi:hypothetical protein
MYMIEKLVRTSYRTQWASIIKNNQLVLHSETIDAYRKNCMKHVVMRT